MFARTQRLLLRPGWPEDWQELARVMNDEGIVCNLASAPWPYTPNDAKQFATRAQNPAFPAFFLILPGDKGSELVGCCGIDQTDDGVEMGYWIARAHWGKGYATEAGRAVAGIAAILGHDHLVAAHFEDNPASGRVLQKIGFSATGKTAMRHSKGRGGEALTHEYVMDTSVLTPGNTPNEIPPLAA